MLAARPTVAGSVGFESCELFSGQSVFSPCSEVGAPGHENSVGLEGLEAEASASDTNDEKSAHISSELGVGLVPKHTKLCFAFKEQKTYLYFPFSLPLQATCTSRRQIVYLGTMTSWHAPNTTF